jgi:hypothetical protein
MQQCHDHRTVSPELKGVLFEQLRTIPRSELGQKLRAIGQEERVELIPGRPIRWRVGSSTQRCACAFAVPKRRRGHGHGAIELEVSLS